MSGTTFSYAQCVKGIPQLSPQLTSSSASASIKDDVPTGNTSVTAPSVASNEADSRDVTKSVQPEAEAAMAKQDSDAASLVGSGSSTASVAGQSVKTRESESTMVDFVQPAEEKGSRSTSQTSRSNDGPDSRKGRKGKKGRATDRDAQSDQNQDDEKEKEATKAQLVPGAPPAVNFWAKRLEEQAAKTKTVPALAQSASAQDMKKRQATEESDVNGASVNGVSGDKLPRKTTELARGADQAQRRSAPRGSRVGEKDDKSAAALPPVADASVWPEPKAAASTEEPNRKPQEKAEVADKESHEDTGAKKKTAWVNVDFTPSVVFNTPLPPPRGAKPRGGGARGGREAGSARGNNGNAPNASLSSVGDKASTAAGASGPKTATTSRPGEGSVTRSASQPQAPLPQAAKRASFDGASKDQRKLTLPTYAEQNREFGIESSTASARRANPAQKGHGDPSAAVFEPGQGLPRIPQERPSNVHPRSAESHAPGHGQQYHGREGRPERGRGSGYRSRGGHNGGAGPHIASSSFTPNGQYANHGGHARHNGVVPSPPPFNGQFQPVGQHPRDPSYGQYSRGRGNRQSSARNGANGASLPRHAAQASEFSMNPYGTPFPYPPPEVVPNWGMIPILRTQIEYYLSIENLCKDAYLRRHIDGQGFVHLNLIAGFKRIQELTKDMELIRVACSASDQIEHVVGDDNIERLRLRIGWEKFVLPVHERDASARNDGPAAFVPCPGPNFPMPQQLPYGGPVAHPPYPAPLSGGLYQSFPENAFNTGYNNDVHYDHAAVNRGDLNNYRYSMDHQLSAVVPEFNPQISSLTLESMTNFPDDRVANLMVVVVDGKDDPGPSAAEGIAGYVDSAQDAVNGTSHNAQAPRVNGGSPNGADHAESLSQATAHEHDIVWLAERASAPAGEQVKRQPYPEIVQAALADREAAPPGEIPLSMRRIYRFWSEMLLKHFNHNIYNQFRDLALADANSATPNRVGLKYLHDYYNVLIYDNDSPKPWAMDRAVPEIFTLHFSQVRALRDHTHTAGPMNGVSI